MLPSPTKPHYSFNTTDLSRIWQGMMHATADVIYDAVGVLALWKHECCRVIADRYRRTTVVLLQFKPCHKVSEGQTQSLHLLCGTHSL